MVPNTRAVVGDELPDAPSAECLPVRLEDVAPPPPALSLPNARSLLARALAWPLDGAAALLHGPPGSGKTTDALLWAGEVAAARRARALVVSAEMTARQVRALCERARVPVGDLEVLEVDTWERVAPRLSPERLRHAAVIVDSLSVVHAGGHPAGSLAAAVEMAKSAYHLAHTHSMHVILLGHETKDGGAAGPLAAAHWVDCVARLTRSALTVGKTRLDVLAERVSREFSPANDSPPPARG